MPSKAKPAASHPVYSEMIADAISTLKERNGSSLQAIKKFFDAKYAKDLPSGWDKKLSYYLKKMAADGKLTKVKASFKLGDTLKAKAKKAAKPKKVKSAAAEAPKKVEKPKVKKTKPAKKPVKKIAVKKTATKKAAPKVKKTAAPTTEKPTKAAKPVAKKAKPTPKKAKAVKKA